MASTSRDSPSKRALEAPEEERQQKRPRFVSDISENSEQEDIESGNVGQSEGNSPEVIYQLSSDNDESLLNALEEQSSNDEKSEVNVGSKQDDSSEEESDDGMKSESNDDRKEGTTQRGFKETKGRKLSPISMDEPDVGTSKDTEKRKRLESSDYTAKTMEDLEDLQEDLHKELAEITGLHKRKHKKAGSSSHREKRHKEKTASRHKEREKGKDARNSDQRDRQKERGKEREREKDIKQRSGENHGDFKREVSLSGRNDHDKGRKYHETDDKPWSYDSRKARSQKEERKEHQERHWMETRLERTSSRSEMKSVVERKVRKESKAPKEVESKAKETKTVQTSKETKTGQKETKQGQSSKDLKTGQTSSKETSKEPIKKGIMSESLRELVRQSIKDNKDLAQEVVEEEESDADSPGPFFPGETSDVSSISATEGGDIDDDDSDDLDDLDDLDDDDDDDKPVKKEKSPELPKLPPYLPAIRGCRSVEEFQWLNRIEEGTYGVVYRAKDKRTGEVVALKKLKMEKEKEGFPITSLREINTLLKSQHPNIVTVQEIVVGSNMDKIYIVMDFVEHDLKALMETMTQSFLAGEIKTIMIQLLRAVNHLHDNWILHRDIKTSNLLLSNKGILKVGDFGLAREYGSPLKPYTPVVVTLWYRAPELLLGAKEYSTPIDIWSVGCVFAELLTMKPLFNGQSEIGQINKIFKELGTPSDKIWPGPPAYSEHPATKKMNFAEYPYNSLRNKFGATLTDNGFELLNSFLTYDPSRRISAEDALKHEYFKESPSPVDPSLFPSWPARSEGAKRAKKSSPKAPEGGNFYKSLSEDGDGAFYMPADKSQGAAVPGFTLKF
ncbi:cyclin-dependent kinase 11B-like [Dendronephthya gigantea]|uniref:cyclin-dependent kinase 11B-like n=1 Tax=Dendronephthya gigantea TaxID=151771 RepID=UPI00106D29DA|nr:cyclin-dependent kinase 11B-like [Dendronephthya gigantea]